MNKKITRRLNDIIFYIEELTALTQNYDYKKFKADIRTTRAVERDLEIIGEAVRCIEKLDQNLLQSVGINTKEIIGMRNILTHDYIRVEADELWNVVAEDIPLLKQKVTKLLS